MRTLLIRTPAALAATALSVTGCSGPPAPPARPLAAQAACTTAVARSPQTVLGARPNPAPDAAARSWGDPPLLLWCGLTPPGPSSEPCLTVNGIDWVAQVDADPIRFTTHGRRPAVQVAVPQHYGRSNAPSALVDLAPVAAALPTEGAPC